MERKIQEFKRINMQPGAKRYAVVRRRVQKEIATTLDYDE
jgi:hypothetical protein